ncbi:hypothetical protein [Wolbachia endosymbiont (group A) of Conops quadrifasciatus]|uniref:hypothetical protein n=1 Tax=Wolbachia endosymbiont (group A) of Conops quadrifasciatus TaxID=3066143 RepID=UPI00313312ED
MTIRELQKELLEEISSLVIEDNDNSIETRQKRALEIIKKLEGHINDDIEINGNLRITVLDCIVRCDSQNNIRLNNKSLVNLENAIKNIG